MLLRPLKTCLPALALLAPILTKYPRINRFRFLCFSFMALSRLRVCASTYDFHQTPFYEQNPCGYTPSSHRCSIPFVRVQGLDLIPPIHNSCQSHHSVCVLVFRVASKTHFALRARCEQYRALKCCQPTFRRLAIRNTILLWRKHGEN